LVEVRRTLDAPNRAVLVRVAVLRCDESEGTVNALGRACAARGDL
jgi:hypothetical protein